MNLVYKGVTGVNGRRRSVEWIDEDYGISMEEWQVSRYQRLMLDYEQYTGKKASKSAARLIEWFSGGERHTCEFISKMMLESYENGQKVRKTE